MIFKIFACIFLLGIPSTLKAAIIQADFIENLAAPNLKPGLPRVLESHNQPVIEGPELTSANAVQGLMPDDKVLNIDLDGDILTLTPDGSDSYEVILVTIQDLFFEFPGQYLESLTLLSNDAVIAPVSQYDWLENGIFIRFYGGEFSTSGDPIELIDGGSVRLQLNFARRVPEPAALGLLGVGLLGIAGLRRCRAI